MAYVLQRVAVVPFLSPSCQGWISLVHGLTASYMPVPSLPTPDLSLGTLYFDAS